MNIGVDGLPEKPCKVYILSNHKEEDKNVKEIHGIDELLKEIHYHGLRGPKKDSKRKDPLFYYRFGPWVLSMDPTNFYVAVVGIVQPNNQNQYWQNVEWKTISKEYTNMRPHIGKDTPIKDVINWINGEDQKIKLELENAYNAQFGLALFFSESIRCFQNHLTNMMAIQLISSGYLSLDMFIDFHPMARGWTWQITNETTGLKKTGLDLLQTSDEHYRSFITKSCYKRNAKRLEKAAKTETAVKIIRKTIDNQITTKMRAFISIKSRISNIFRTWLSLQTFDESYSERLFEKVSADAEKLLKSLQSQDHLRPYELQGAAGPLLQEDSEVVSSNNKGMQG